MEKIEDLGTLMQREAEEWLRDKEHGQVVFRNSNYIEKDIIVPTGIFIPKSMKSLPKNCILDKGLTGSGGTTIAIEDSSTHQIILVPTKNIIASKVVWSKKPENIECGKVIFISSDREHISKVKDIKDAIRSSENRFNGKIKIMATYDAIGKIIEAIDELKSFSIKDFHLVVDEYQMLLEVYSYRSKAVDGIIRNFRKFKSFTLMTANFSESCFEEFQDIPIQRIVFEDYRTIQYNMIGVEVTSGEGGTSQERYGYMISKELRKFVGLKNDGRIEITDFHGHVFLNSTDDIIHIIKGLARGLSQDEIKSVVGRIKIVAARDKKTAAGSNEVKLGELAKELGVDSIKISNIDDKPNRLNFYTSTAFQGVDIEDKGADIMIVSNTRKDYTKPDIVTMMPQITGRMRNPRSDYFSKVTVFYDIPIGEGASLRIVDNGRADINMIKAVYEDEMKDFIAMCQFYNDRGYSSAKYIAKKKAELLAKPNTIYDETEDKFRLNKSYATSFMYSIRSAFEYDTMLFTVRPTGVRQDRGINIEDVITNQIHNPSLKQIFNFKYKLRDNDSDIPDIISNVRLKPKEAVMLYKKFMDGTHFTDAAQEREAVMKAKETIPNIDEWFEYLTMAQMKAFNFSKKKINDEIDAIKSDKVPDKNKKIKRAFRIKNKSTISVKIVKERIRSIEKRNGWLQSASPEEFFKGVYILQKTRGMSNSKRIYVYRFIGPLI